MKHQALFQSLIPTVIRWAEILTVIAMIAGLILLSSCFKEKALQPPTQQGEIQTGLIEMGPQYGDQFFYSLETNTVLSRNSRMAYDLLFECDAASFRVWLNSAKFMSAARTGKTDLSAVTLADGNNKKWWYDTGAFNPDSSAIGEWWATLGPQITSKGEVYIINLGVDSLGNPLGYVKFKLNDFSSTGYSITYSDLNNQQVHTVTIPKDATRNYRYVALNNGNEMVDGIEPEKNSWDLCFTQYSVLFYDPYYLPYQVTGVLSNPTRVEAYMDSTIHFDSISLISFENNRFSSRRDVIGYEWKRYGLGTSSIYTVNQHFNYFIRTASTNYYKLRFYSFYKNGLTGYPAFEFVKF